MRITVFLQRDAWVRGSVSSEHESCSPLSLKVNEVKVNFILRWLPELRAGCSRDQYVNYPTQPHDQNKTKIDHAFFKNKAISERFLMEKSVE
jgi:hypothetical protein